MGKGTCVDNGRETYLITGGCGSLGKALVKRLLPEAKKIIVYSRDEYKHAKMEKEFKDRKLRFMVGDIRDRDRLERAMTKVTVVIHTAALKRVDISLHFFQEFMKTNYQGTLNVCESAGKRAVSKVVCIGTDKSVEPVTAYGVSKAAGDYACIQANATYPKTLYTLVRYGNVVRSRGSVVPLFESFCEEGLKELPITDERMTRFWITIDEAVDLVLLAIKEMQGGEAFIPKMPSFRLTDLVGAFGKTWYLIGIREQEKIHEVMITEHDEAYDNGDYYVVYSSNTPLVGIRQTERKGKKVILRYDSKHNDFLSIEEIKRRLR
jgi:FlaA1/EpsC-like NDP-sugar epimerase